MSVWVLDPEVTTVKSFTARGVNWWTKKTVFLSIYNAWILVEIYDRLIVIFVKLIIIFNRWQLQ